MNLIYKNTTENMIWILVRLKSFDKRNYFYGSFIECLKVTAVKSISVTGIIFRACILRSLKG